MYTGTYIKYSDTIGSMTLADAAGNIYVWRISNGVYGIDNLQSKVQVAWLINKSVDAAGYIHIGDSNTYKYVLSVGLGNTTDPNIIVDRIWKNEYNMWYVRMAKKDGTDYTNTNALLNLGVLYLAV